MKFEDIKYILYASGNLNLHEFKDKNGKIVKDGKIGNEFVHIIQVFDNYEDAKIVLDLYEDSKQYTFNGLQETEFKITKIEDIEILWKTLK